MFRSKREMHTCMRRALRMKYIHSERTEIVCDSIGAYSAGAFTVNGLTSHYRLGSVVQKMLITI